MARKKKYTLSIRTTRTDDYWLDVMAASQEEAEEMAEEARKGYPVMHQGKEVWMVDDKPFGKNLKHNDSDEDVEVDVE